VEYRPAWITSATKTADIRFSTDSTFKKESFMSGGILRERCWLTNVKITYQEEKRDTTTKTTKKRKWASSDYELSK